MEIIKIGSDSFKISLTDDEAKKYEITSDNTNDDSLSESIRSLLDIAKKSNGIDFGKDRIATEIFISKDGGCDIFVSRGVKRSEPLKSKREATQRAIYRFNNIEDLLRACKRLKAILYSDEICVYHNKTTGSYFLLVLGIYPKDIKYAFLCEYGERIKNNLIFYIDEYCEKICENNALEILSKLL